ncbi:MAG: hypothetical protein F2563_00740 [Actinobacteria bacterium]|uniref:Unannotated protein n=1 Tax=freshwater metagenome TaxID=449393 RepID=A0A6J6DX73_9ZZZZ|nr:hypothetical protein [Actinomycetota bacterium]
MKRSPFTLIAPAVAALQILVLVVIALITLIGSLVTGEVDSWVNLWVELLLYLIFIAGYLLVLRGLWQLRTWARAPMIAIQLIVIGISYEDFWQSDPVLWKIVAVALTLVSLTAIVATLKSENESK